MIKIDKKVAIPLNNNTVKKKPYDKSEFWEKILKVTLNLPAWDVQAGNSKA